MNRPSTNRPQALMTANPKKYPQGYFKKKPCKRCGTLFQPKAPSHLYCSQKCADEGWSNNYLKNEYGISKDEYDSMLISQKGRCAICGSEGFLMREHHWSKLVTDHDHKTGHVRGLLCHNCNRGLGLFQDSISNLKQAIQYLERATTISKESTPKPVEAHGNGCLYCGDKAGHGGLMCPQLQATA